MNSINKRKRIVPALVAAALVASLSACGLSAGNAAPYTVGPGSIKPIAALKGVPITVGSKDFTEQILLAYIAEYALQAAGMDVKDLSDIEGSNSGRQALSTGQIDLMWEYTGTAWISYLNHNDPIADPNQMFDEVKKLDKANHVDWVVRAPLNDVYAFAQSESVKKKYGITNISQLTELAKKDPSAVTLCIESEFASRNDGLPGVVKKYGLNVPSSNIKLLDTGAVYKATADAKSCNFGEVYTTDARLRSLNLSLLADDKKSFPAYNASVTLREEIATKYPQIAQVLQPVADKLTNEAMIDMATQVDVKGRDWADVAKEWMVNEGFVTNKTNS